MMQMKMPWKLVEELLGGRLWTKEHSRACKALWDTYKRKEKETRQDEDRKIDYAVAFGGGTTDSPILNQNPQRSTHGRIVLSSDSDTTPSFMAHAFQAPTSNYNSAFPARVSDGKPWICWNIQDNPKQAKWCPFHSVGNADGSGFGDIEDTAQALKEQKKKIHRACQQHVKQRLMHQGQELAAMSLPYWKSPSDLGIWLIEQLGDLY
jgi:hypothetical protein